MANLRQGWLEHVDIPNTVWAYGEITNSVWAYGEITNTI